MAPEAERGASQAVHPTAMARAATIPASWSGPTRTVSGCASCCSAAPHIGRRRRLTRP